MRAEAHRERGLPWPQQRRLERLSEEVDRVLESDRRFFARRPERQHRVRLASKAEIALNREVAGWDRHKLPDGFAYFVAVKQMVPGARARVFLHATASASTDLTEEVARKIFEATFRNTGSILDEEGQPA